MTFPAIWGVDTRTLTRIIRDEGSQKVIITGADTPLEEALRKVREYAASPRHGFARELQKTLVCRASPTTNTTWWRSTAASSYNIIRQLNRVGCNVTVVPFELDAGGDHGLPSRRRRAVERSRATRRT